MAHCYSVHYKNIVCLEMLRTHMQMHIHLFSLSLSLHPLYVNIGGRVPVLGQWTSGPQRHTHRRRPYHPHGPQHCIPSHLQRYHRHSMKLYILYLPTVSLYTYPSGIIPYTAPGYYVYWSIFVVIIDCSLLLSLLLFGCQISCDYLVMFTC